MEKKNNLNKIIIVTSVIIIIFILIIFLIFVFTNKDNYNNVSNNIFENVSQIDETQEENDKMLQDENITIIDDNTVNLNRKFGKIEIVWID